MDDLQRTKDGLAEIQAQLRQMVRMGSVVSVDPARATARVELRDADKLVSHDLPVLQARAHGERFYSLPTPGERVLCLFLGMGVEAGFILGSFYSAADAPPADAQEKTRLEFEDGTWLEYDRAAHKLAGSVAGDVDLAVEKTVKLSAGQSVEIVSPMTFIRGNLTATGEGGQPANETKAAHTAQMGSFSLIGPLHVDGNITCTGVITGHVVEG